MNDLDVWRAAAVALCSWACGYERGRDKDDAVYTEVTEGRDRGIARAGYSSCADLGHWLYKRLGLRTDWLNRTDDHHAAAWQPGVNVSRLAWSPVAFTPPPTWRPQAGDLLVIWSRPNTTDSHVCIALGYDQGDERRLLLANYGAGGMSAAVSPGARISTVDGALLPSIGRRKIHRAITLASVVPLLTAPPELDGPEWTDTWTGEMADRLREVQR